MGLCGYDARLGVADHVYRLRRLVQACVPNIPRPARAIFHLAGTNPFGDASGELDAVLCVEDMKGFQSVGMVKIDCAFVRHAGHP